MGMVAINYRQIVKAVSSFYESHQTLFTHKNYPSRLLRVGQFKLCARCAGIAIGYIIGGCVAILLWKSNYFPVVFCFLPLFALCDNILWRAKREIISVGFIFFAGILLSLPIPSAALLFFRLNGYALFFVIFYALLLILYLKNFNS